MENNLNEQDQFVFSKLVDPDIESQAKYPWSVEFQQVLVGMLLSDRFFLSQSVGLIKPAYFKSEVHQFLVRFLYKFFDDYKSLPSKVFVEEAVDEHLKKKCQHKPEDYNIFKTIFLGELKTIYLYYSKGGVGNMMPGLDSTEALLDKITAFAKTQAMKMAFHKSLDLIRKNPEADTTWDKVNEIVKEAQLVNREIDAGLDYFQTIEERYARMLETEKNTESFSTGFKKIDDGLANGGVLRGEIGACMALPGRGKSLNLVLAAIKNIQNGKKVLYITTEMDSDRVAFRFDAMFSQVGQHKLLIDKEQVWRAVKETVQDHDDKRRLVVKQFPSGNADVNTVRAYHAQLGMLGFRPDMIIVDYPGDFKEQPGIPTWESMFRTIRDLRGFGVEENHCTLVAIQPNRTASELTIDEVMDESTQGGSFGQNRVFDVFWTLNQTLHEKNACVGRVYVAKARNGKANYRFRIHYDFQNQTLMMAEISERKYDELMARAQDQTSDTTNDMLTKQTRVFEESEGEQLPTVLEE